eukprot:690227-Pyramimonas_sp.AAC.1
MRCTQLARSELIKRSSYAPTIWSAHGSGVNLTLASNWQTHHAMTSREDLQQCPQEATVTISGYSWVDSGALDSHLKEADIYHCELANIVHHPPSHPNPTRRLRFTLDF